MVHSSIKLNSPAEFVNVTSINPLISKCEIKVCYVGDEPNRNKSIITKEVATDMANSLPGSAIVGYYNENKEDFEEHNRTIEIANGEVKFKETTRPYGFVPTDAKVWFQKFLDDGMNEHEYLMTEGYLWTGQYPECQRVIEKGNNQSMELDPESLQAEWAENDNGKPEFFIINEAIISKLCILGEDVEPCFEGASIGKVQFAFEEEFKTQFFSMVKQLEDLLKGGTEQMENVNNETIVNEEVIVEENNNTETFAKCEEEICPECGKPLSECTCDKSKNSVETCPECGKQLTECACGKKKKKNYCLEDVVEYTELQSEYNDLQTKFNELTTENEQLTNELAELREFKASVEKSQKQAMIDKFTMLSDEDKLEVVENIDKYSLDEIEAKLCVICVHNRVSFDDSDNDKNKTNAPVNTFNLDSTIESDDSTIPAWIKVLKRVANENN